MDIRYKLFPYPVLAYFSDDYRNSAFDVSIDFSKDGYNLRIDFMATLKNKGLLDLIDEGKAHFVYHLECAQTGFRKVIQTQKKAEYYVISNKDVCGRLQVCPFIVATEDLQGYSNDSFHEDYLGMSFNIEAGCVMAVDKQANIDITKNMDDLSNVPSIFAIIRNTDISQKQMLVDVEQTRIIIQLPEEDYYNYKGLNMNASMRFVLNSMVVLPALLYALEEVRNRPAAERYMLEEYGWYKTIRKVLRREFDCDIETETFNSQNMLVLAQKMINEPLRDALIVLANINDSGEEAAS